MKSKSLRRCTVALLQVSLALSFSLVSYGQESADPNQEGNARALEAAALLVERCGSCHGPDSKDRKATRGWADARDLAATVADPELIVPGEPDDSWLFAVIEDGDMPPSDSDVAPLDAAERAVLASWIRDGATVPIAEEAPLAEEAVTEEVLVVTESPAQPEVDVPVHWMKQPWPKWLGRFHPTIVHFPIALLTAAFLAELLARVLRKPQLHHAATFSYTLGALSTVPSAAFGWLLAESTTHRGHELDDHRWLGVAVATVAVLGMTVFYRKPGLRLPLLALLAVLVGITGHLGGSLSYGSDWLSPPF
ncbi:Planctomycete cytochrome C [Planctomycetes bacterium Poly30]|uniref:Planctomycete cytochrome C n=1 Tax=Saltatorellus ferox TaxID=2528018 RepID=A0A518ELX8_9BACT|nr:Planctomycete cytochrome C [Planctomycetes bacterium Poly30]